VRAPENCVSLSLSLSLSVLYLSVLSRSYGSTTLAKCESCIAELLLLLLLLVDSFLYGNLVSLLRSSFQAAPPFISHRLPIPFYFIPLYSLFVSRVFTL
jgi:hypothetical protein